MSPTQLLEPVLTDGIRTTHFFNGRVLTAQDLRTEQDANRSHHRQLAAGLGEGVVHGLEVTRADPVDGVPAVRIDAGLGYNRDGDPIELGRLVELRLVRVEADVPPEAGLFAVCVVPDRPLELTNVGLYVLSARPASAYSDERAPMTELGSEGVAGGCGSKWAVEGVQFSVAPLPLAPAGTTPSEMASALGELAELVETDVDHIRRGGASDTPEVRSRLARSLSRLRNGAAHLCFGTDSAADRLASPLPSGPHFEDVHYGALDGMRQREELASCDLPLALFYLSRRGLEWVDGWSVRRPPIPALAAGSLPVLPSDRRRTEALALVLQFQQHLHDLTTSELSASDLAETEAADFFRLLPPVGFLPVQGSGVTRAFLSSSFFSEVRAGGPVRIPGDRLAGLVDEALHGPPLDLHTRGTVELFRLDENVGGAGSVQPYVAFVNRDSQGLAARGPVAAVLRQAWSAYRELLRRRAFIPLDPEAASASARVAVPAAFQSVMAGAMEHATLAAARRLPTADALAGFGMLRTLQLELADLLATGMPGVPDTENRLDFSLRLRGLLNEEIPAGRPGLGPAVEAGNVAAAVDAQEEINHLVGTWSGEMGIVEFDPPIEAAVGQLLTIRGRNFAFPPDRNTVTVGGEPVESFRPGSNDARLVFEIPDVPNLGDGRDVTIRIAFGDNEVEAEYRVLPRQEVEGNPPEIDDTLRENGSPNLRAGELAIITGSHFGDDPSAISLQVRHLASDQVVEVPAETVELVSPSEIRFMIPALDMLPPRGAQPCAVELTVGDHPAAIDVVDIRR